HPDRAEAVPTDRPGAEPTQQLDVVGAMGRRGHPMAAGHELRHEPLTDRPGSPCKKHAHRSLPSRRCRPLRRERAPRSDSRSRSLPFSTCPLARTLREMAQTLPLEPERDVRGAYPPLFAEVTLILARHNLMGIALFADEYEPEAPTILPRLHTASNPPDVLQILEEEFDHWFGPFEVGERGLGEGGRSCGRENLGRVSPTRGRSPAKFFRVAVARRESAFESEIRPISRAAMSAANRWPRWTARVKRPDAVPWLVIVPMPLGRRLNRP